MAPSIVSGKHHVNRSLSFVAVLLVSLAGCTLPSLPMLDGGTPSPDAGDCLPVPVDGGEPVDAGVPDAGTDAPVRTAPSTPGPALEPDVETASDDAEAPGYERGVVLVALRPERVPGLRQAADPGTEDLALVPASLRAAGAAFGLRRVEALFRGDRASPARLSSLATRFPTRAARGHAGYRFPALDHVFRFVVSRQADVEAAAKAFAADATVQYALPNRVARAQLVPNDPFYGAPNQWNLPLIGAPTAWNVADGSGQVVAVVDTGIDFQHPQFVGQLWTNAGEVAWNGMDDDGNGYVDDVNGYDFAYGDGYPDDLQGHGSHVAGIVAARTNDGAGVAGLAYGARIMALKGLNNGGSGLTSDLAQALAYALTEGADVVNNSWGGAGRNLLIESLVDALHGAGAVVVAAGGNSAQLTHLYFPTNAENALSVGASTAQDTLSSFSNFGVKLDVVAPGGNTLGLGGDVLSPVPVSSWLPGPVLVGAQGERYKAMPGTSMAAPHVAALAAMLRQQHPTWSVEEVRAAIKQTALDLGGPGMDDVFGSGRIRADLATALPAQAPVAANLQFPLNGEEVSGPAVALLGEASGGLAPLGWQVEAGVGSQPGSWSPVGAAGLGAQPMNSALGTLDTLTLPDGWNTLRLRVTDGAQQVHEDRNLVRVRNVFITTPSPLQSVSGLVPVTGSAAGNLGFVQYDLAWAPGCGATVGFTTFHSSTAQVPAVGPLGTWDTTVVPPGPVTLRLSAQFAYGTPTDDVCVIVDPQLAPGFPAPLNAAPAFKSPKLADLDGDGIREIVVGAAVLKANGSVMPGWTNNPGLGRTNSVVFDVNGDGMLDVVGDDHDGTPSAPNGGNAVVYAWNAAHQVLWSFPVQNPQAGPNQLQFNVSTLGSLSAGDVDGDGDLDVVFTAFFWYWNTSYDTTVFVLEGSTGALLNSFTLPGVGQASVALADLDGDGKDDLVTETWYPPTSVGYVHAVHANGAPLPGWPQTVPPVNVQGFGNIDPVLADVNRDGQLDVWVGKYLFSASGAVHPGFPTPYLNRSTGAFAPMDGDCPLELVGGGANSIRSWGVDDTGGLDHLQFTSGENLMVLMFGENGSQGNPVVADVTGDGLLDTLRPAELGFLPGGKPIALYGAESATGTGSPNFPRYVANPSPQGWTDPIRPTAAVGDLDNDGLLEIVQVVNRQVYVWNTGKPITPASRYWPMFQRDLRSSGVLPPGLGAADLLAVDYVQGRLYDVDSNSGNVSNPRPTVQFALGLTRDATGVTWMVSETTGTASAMLYTVDTTTGAATPVAPLSGTLTEGDIAVDPTTQVLYLVSGNGMLYTVAQQSGILGFVGQLPGVLDTSGLTFDPQGNLYVLDGVPGVLYRVDKSNAAVLAQVSLGGAAAPMPNHKVSALAWDAASGRLLTTVDASPTPLLYSLDPQTGALASVGSLSPATHVSGLAVSCQ